MPRTQKAASPAPASEVDSLATAGWHLTGPYRRSPDILMNLAHVQAASVCTPTFCLAKIQIISATNQQGYFTYHNRRKFGRHKLLELHILKRPEHSVTASGHRSFRVVSCWVQYEDCQFMRLVPELRASQ